MAEDFTHKVALVTGGGSGIGEACATRLAARGATVVTADIAEEAARQVARKIRSGGGTAHMSSALTWLTTDRSKIRWPGSLAGSEACTWPLTTQPTPTVIYTWFRWSI